MKNKKVENKISEMSELMHDGYGLVIDSVKNDLFDKVMVIDHNGGTKGIFDTCEVFCSLIFKVATVNAMLLTVAQEEGFPDIFKDVKTTDVLDIDMRYMESDDAGGYHFTIHQKKTGIKTIDNIVRVVITITTGEYSTKIV